MRNCIQTRSRIAVVAGTMAVGSMVLLLAQTVDARRIDSRKIEAVRGKRYKLSKQHGPWMIMVASFHEPPPEAKAEGMTPQQAADELVYELRKKGIPAYAFSQGKMQNELNTYDRFGRRRRYASYTARQKSICVLAGNYSSEDDRLAQRTKNYVKRFHPRFLRAVDTRTQTDSGLIERFKSGGIYRMTPGRPGPLSGAFLTINPALTPDEVKRRHRDPLLLKLNSGMDYNLLDNPGRFTLVVATSFVKSTTKTNDSEFQKAIKNFKISNSLDESALGAWQLAKTLREGRVPFQHRRAVVQRNFEAYVYHDHHRSIVTIGSFDSSNDPRIAEFKRIFGAKVKSNPNTGKDVLIAEVMTLPDLRKRNASLKTWIFDPTPQLIEVPKLR